MAEFVGLHAGLELAQILLIQGQARANGLRVGIGHPKDTMTFHITEAGTQLMYLYVSREGRAQRNGNIVTEGRG